MEKKIQFNDHVQIFIVPFEERKGIWMQYAMDRTHFRRRIEKNESLLAPVLCQKLNEFKMSEVNLG